MDGCRGCTRTAAAEGFGGSPSSMTVDWHSDPDAMKRDRRRCAAFEDVGWVVISIVFEDVRYRAWEVVMLERPERARSARS